MKTLKISDEQALIIAFSLRLYATECDNIARGLANNASANGEMMTINRQRAEQARTLSTQIARVEQHD